MITSGAKDSPRAAMSTVPFANALVNLDVTQMGEGLVSLPGQPVSGQASFSDSQTDSLNSLTASSLSQCCSAQGIWINENKGKKTS